MHNAINIPSDLVVEYTDHLEGFKGWLVIDSMAHTLCAGGLRVQKGLTRGTVERLAANMTLKMRIAGIRADGAKSGIDYDPTSPGKQEALFRFLQAIKPYILERYSIGPDMNTTQTELDALCARLGISSMKHAVAQAQGFPPETFAERVGLLSEQAGPEPLGRLRAGVGLAAAAMAALDFKGLSISGATAAIQGFGCLAASAAYFLNKAGVQVIALADCEKSLISSKGSPLDIPVLIQDCRKGIIPEDSQAGRYGTREDIYDVACDVFIPAAVEGTVGEEEAHSMKVETIACGANLAIAPEAEIILHDRGILLIPDMIAGCGGSLSMDGLFGPDFQPTVTDVLNHVSNRTRCIVKKTLQRSMDDGVMPREAALRICAEAPLFPDTRPYGTIKNNQNSPN